MKKTFMATALMTGVFLAAGMSIAAPNQKDVPFHNQVKKMERHQEMSEAQKAEMEKRKAEMEKRLNITEEQKKQFKAIHEEAKMEIVPKIRQLTEIEHEISVLERKKINKEKYNINTLEEVHLSGKSIEQLKADRKTLKNEIREIKMKQFEKSQKIFTDEQKKELEKMRQEHIELMEKAGKPTTYPMPRKK